MAFLFETEVPKKDGYMVDESSITSSFDYSKNYRSQAFNECMNYFNVEDKITRRVLLSVNEDDQSLVMSALANKLYGYIVDKISDVDFGTIPNSKGDIEKIDNYEQLRDCIGILSQIMQNYNQSTEQIDTVSIALENLIDRKDIFIRGFRSNANFIIVTYNTLALSIVSSVSLLISSHIEFIKMNEDKGYNIAFNKAAKLKSKDKLLFTNLEKFNKMCSSGEFDKTMDYAMKTSLLAAKPKREAVEDEDIDIDDIDVADAASENNGSVEEAGVTLGAILGAMGGMLVKGGSAVAGVMAGHPVITAIAGVIIGLILLIKVIRDVIFYFYYSRTKFADYMDTQSALLYVNAMNVQNSLSKDEKERKKIAERQTKVAKLFTKVADTVRVKDKTAEVKAQSDINKVDAEKYNIMDVVSDIPASSANTLF